PQLHSNLAAVIDRAVRFHPRDRFTSAKEMLAALPDSPQLVTKATVPVAGNPHPQPQTETSPTTPSPNTSETGNSWSKWLLWALLFIGPIPGGLSFGYLIIKQAGLIPLPNPTTSTPNSPNSTVEKLPLIQPQNQINSLVLNRDGQTLVGGDEKGNIYLWEAETGKLKKTLAGHHKAILAIAISNDQQTLTSSSEDGTLKVWNLKTEKERRTLPPQPGLIALALSADGNTLVTGG
ncbi:MAG: hypothetical protein ACKO2V_26990, partial [Snowella sp.]